VSVDNEAIVVSIESGMATVEVEKTGGCGRCGEPGGCGNTLLTQMRPVTPRRYKVPNEIDAKVGDRVIVSVPEGAVLSAALSVYVIPLACLVLGVAVGTLLGSEIAAVAGGAIGLIAGFLFLKGRASSLSQPRFSMRVWEEQGTCSVHGR
jgi:sigma-E factor negative regulatory protein RseC